MTREEELDWLYRLRSEIYVYMPKEWLIPMNNALKMAIHALQQEPCGDAISRQAVLNMQYRIDDSATLSTRDVVNVDDIENLPSVNPQEPKIGQWIQTNEFFINQDGQFIYKFICSECKSLSYFRKSNKKAIGANVCPNCGARMQVVGNPDRLESKESDAENLCDSCKTKGCIFQSGIVRSHCDFYKAESEDA